MVKINMMCGKRDWSKEGWISIDQEDFEHIDSRDIWMNAQFDDSIDLIYCSHGIGYFDANELMDLFHVWYTKLRPAGILRIATPDFNILSKMYQVDVEMGKLIGPLMGRMKTNGIYIYHKSLWGEKELSKLLGGEGFTNIHRYDHSKVLEHPNTGNREDYFDDHSASYINGTLISLNLECSKP